MSAAVVYVFNERQTCWRTQTPGVAAAGDSTVTAWCYSPKRKSVVWSQDGNGNQPDIYKNDTDDDLAAPIPGGTLQTYPIVPDGDMVALKRFHEASFTVSNVDSVTASAVTFTISCGAGALGSQTVTPSALVGNEGSSPPAAPAFSQCRYMVPRAAHVSGHIVLNFAPGSGNATRWRLHAIDVMWQPESPRSLNR